MMRGFLFASGTQVNGLRHRTPEYSGSRCFQGVECPFVFSSSAEIPAFCPGNQCLCTCFPLRLSPLRGPPAETSIAWRFSGHSRKVTPLTFVFPKNTWLDTPFSSFPLPFVCPYLLSSCFIYFSFILSQCEYIKEIKYSRTSLIIVPEVIKKENNNDSCI